MKLPEKAKSMIYKRLRWILEPLGFDIFIQREGNHYVPNYFGRSTRKQQDIRELPVFGELANKVIQNRHTYLYYDRLYTIYQIMVGLKIHNDQNQIINTAELGVYKGGSSYFIASLAKQLNMPINHFCFDTFEGHSNEDVNLALEPVQTPGSFHNTSFESVKEYLSGYENVQVYKGRFQETCSHLESARFNFVHMDMDIYAPTIFALRFFDGRMTKGGVILLDDHGFDSCPGIEKAAAEFISTIDSQYFSFSMLTGQFILIKL
jgi:O-methyltransferase